MTRIRLRAARPEGEAAFYADRYPDGYRHDGWPDHVERVAASVDMIRQYHNQVVSVADLSCGDGAIIRGLLGMKRFRVAYLGDLNGAPGTADWGLRRVRTHAVPDGLLPATLEHLDGQVDLFVLSETLEHVDDPDDLLRRIGGCARYLFLSTPLDESPREGNPEHYWGWGQADIHGMLQASGWDPLELKLLKPVSTQHMPGAYTYQLWMAVRA
ncbi:class I SAM-dependent methyltransferase [Streptomyces sp. S1D4-14]|uniref:class I SAM-dependent methyltransferase n=1 Tax=Streptomyces sp. S1D4-14 TaxID=2594461 RepID=UPI00116575EA|nr:class I SAM-dependent methyltransferase [Streptomyces sp. S1D4-14]QDN64369.1 class I SAM-dependent methyltransferase [Streptomyces sp. S1D4-14]